MADVKVAINVNNPKVTKFKVTAKTLREAIQPVVICVFRVHLPSSALKPSFTMLPTNGGRLQMGMRRGQAPHWVKPGRRL